MATNLPILQGNECVCVRRARSLVISSFFLPDKNAIGMLAN